MRVPSKEKRAAAPSRFATPSLTQRSVAAAVQQICKDAHRFVIAPLLRLRQLLTGTGDGYSIYNAADILYPSSPFLRIFYGKIRGNYLEILGF